jgi:hypothetical protein
MLSAALTLLLLADKPLCTKKIQGQLWPLPVNGNKTVLLNLARAGSLEMCVASTWGYKWTQLTVNIHQAER